MCGIAGFIDLKTSMGIDELHRRGESMARAMNLRGPDHYDAWADGEAGIALAHARLSIIDLSSAGHQPMTSHCGRYVLVFNGEIYNAEDIRCEMDASIEWRGHSDTEVILEAFATWGVGDTLKRCIGMFTIALWDKNNRTLTLARDRLGIKPLYWGERDNVFLFGSELKALIAQGGWTRKINRNALAAYMRMSYVPAPHSIFEGIHKLEPGHVLVRSETGGIKTFCYWNLRSLATAASRKSLDISDAEAEEELDRLIRDSVSRRLVADVPVGAFLSGGIDSSTVVGAMCAESKSTVHSYSIGFDEDGYDEAKYAAAVAGHLKTDHMELYVSSGDARDQIPNLPGWYDEPFADASQIPTYLVSKLARQSVTVALSGDGGDELFCGYNRYLWGDRMWRQLEPWPDFVRRGAAGLIRGLSPESWDRLGGTLPKNMRPNQLGIKAHKVAGALTAHDSNELYRSLVSVWNAPETIVRGASEPGGLLWDETTTTDVKPFMERMQMFDALTYLPDQILTKVDRASMAVSLEARVPLLDHRIAEFAMSLPREMRMRDGQSKWLLRKVLERYVPRHMFERPKAGFGVPVGQWLRGPLRDWAEDLLDPVKLEQDGFLNAAPIRAAWNEHLSGIANRETQLWTVLMFQAWRQRWMNGLSRLNI